MQSKCATIHSARGAGKRGKRTSAASGNMECNCATYLCFCVRALNGPREGLGSLRLRLTRRMRNLCSVPCVADVAGLPILLLLLLVVKIRGEKFSCCQKATGEINGRFRFATSLRFAGEKDTPGRTRQPARDNPLSRLRLYLLLGLLVLGFFPSFSFFCNLVGIILINHCSGCATLNIYFLLLLVIRLGCGVHVSFEAVLPGN